MMEVNFFDNERPTSNTKLTPFILTDFVTNEDWIEFIEDEAYSRPELGFQMVGNLSIKIRLISYLLIDNNYLFNLNGVENINMIHLFLT